jgi:hypothetical protein
MRETEDEILRCAQNDNGGESHHRFAVPLPLTREAKDGGRGGTGVAEPRPYGSTLVRKRDMARRVVAPYGIDGGAAGYCRACGEERRGDLYGRPGTGDRFFAALRMTTGVNPTTACGRSPSL